MWELIPGFGDRKSRERLDELFDRRTLGSVLFGGHVMKVFEKVYNLLALVVILVWVFEANVYDSILLAVTLLLLWFAGFVGTVYAFVYWEEVEDITKQKAEDVKDKAEDVKDKAKEKANGDEE